MEVIPSDSDLILKVPSLIVITPNSVSLVVLIASPVDVILYVPLTILTESLPTIASSPDLILNVPE